MANQGKANPGNAIPDKKIQRRQFHEGISRQVKTRQGKAYTGKTRHIQSRQGKANLGNKNPGKARQANQATANPG